MEAMMEATKKLASINHVMLNTGRSKVVPRAPSDKVLPQGLIELGELIKGGGGPVPNTNGRYRLCIVADDVVSFDFTIWKNNTVILMCAYQDGPAGDKENWNDFLAKTAPFGDIRKQEMPKSPWLMSAISPAHLQHDGHVPWLRDFAEEVADTWRRLPACDRSPIFSPSLDFLRSKKPNMIHKTAIAVNPAAFTQGLQKQLKGLSQTIDRLRTQIRSMAKADNDLMVKTREIPGLRQEVDRLKQEASISAANIKTLERTNANLKSEIEQRVSSQVAEVRKVAEDNELRVMLAEEQQAEATRRAESAERKLKHLEQWTRRQGMDPAMAFPHGTNLK